MQRLTSSLHARACQDLQRQSQNVTRHKPRRGGPHQKPGRAGHGPGSCLDFAKILKGGRRVGGLRIRDKPCTRDKELGTSLR